MNDSARSTIMVVDDEQSNLALLEAFLLPHGYDVIKASDGEQALNMLKSTPVDLMFLDIIMPGMSGFDVLREVKKNEADTFIPVVLLTAHGSKEHRVTGLEMGADDFMSKPFDSSVLLARTRSLLRTKDLYDRLQQSYNDLKLAEENKELITHMMVHDLRNPLMVIYNSLELMSSELKDQFSPEDVIAPGNIMRACRRMATMIDNILDIGKMEDGRLQLVLESIDLSELLQELINEYRAEAVAKGAKIHCYVADSVPRFWADKNFLTRVLENLISNALRYLPDKGEVCLNAFLDDAANMVVISVIDNGVGIPPEYLDKIFDKYEQVNLRKKGIIHTTGLGLTFCKMVVEAHGGRIWAESKPGKGSVFSFAIPAS